MNRIYLSLRRQDRFRSLILFFVLKLNLFEAYYHPMEEAPKINGRFNSEVLSQLNNILDNELNTLKLNWMLKFPSPAEHKKRSKIDPHDITRQTINDRILVRRTAAPLADLVRERQCEGKLLQANEARLQVLRHNPNGGPAAHVLRVKNETNKFRRKFRWGSHAHPNLPRFE